MGDGASVLLMQMQTILRLQSEQFRAGLDGRLEEIERLFALAARPSSTAPDWAALHRAVHSLQGSAGTFECLELSDAALPFKDCLQAIVEGAQPPAASELEAHLKRVRLAIRAATPRPAGVLGG